MLDKVQTIWITGFLDQSLEKEARIALGLSERPEAVLRSLDVVSRLPNQSPQHLPANTQIVEVFDAHAGQLLILGAPGAGKTTLLLELARNLLTRAKQNPDEPIPVVFPLSSWAQKRRPLADWLVDELNQRYDVPQKVAQYWIEKNQILPLLDGLDEVAPSYRGHCIEVINRFQQDDRGLLPLVVCCRVVDYEVAGTPLRLQGAVVVQPLTREQVNEYIVRVGDPLASIRLALHTDAALWELLDTPLMLNIMTLAYRGQQIAPVQADKSLEARRQHLFSAYVDRMFRQRNPAILYKPEQILHWLAWLARQMVGHNLTVFYVERMQPDWFPDLRKWRLAYGLVSGLLVGLVFGLFSVQDLRVWTDYVLLVEIGYYWLSGFGLIWGPTSGLLVGLCSGLISGLVCGRTSGLVYGLVFGLFNVLICYGQVSRLVSGLGSGQGSERISALASVLFPGQDSEQVSRQIPVPMVAQRAYGQVSRQVSGLISGLVSGLISGLIGGIFFRLISGLDNEGIIPAETVGWSISTSSLRGGLVSGLRLGIVSALLSGLFFGLGDGWLFGLFYGLGLGLGVGLISGLVIIFSDGLSLGEIDTKIVPNQGIRRSARHALVFGLFSGLVFALGGGLVFALSGRWLFREGGALFSGLGGALIVGLSAGGRAYLKHFLLRFLLFWRGSVPWNYPALLDVAADYLFLRKVGGGYIFVHRLLMEYFAALPNA